MTVKAVFFDMGGTIDTFWYSQELRLQMTPELQSLFKNFGINLHLTDVQLYNAITNGLARYHQWRLKTLDELPPRIVWRKYIFANCEQDLSSLDNISDDLMAWIETHYYQRKMRPEVPSILDAIQTMGLKIGLISNVNSRGQVPLNLNQYGIKQYFNPIVLSSEYKRRKPDPSIFHYAARLSNTPTSECIYVGDRISRDIVGSKRAGYKLSIQIKHDFNHGEQDEGAIPDFVISNLDELLIILRGEIDATKKYYVRKKPEKKIRAVFFDADGVLYYRKNKDKGLNSFISEYCHTRLKDEDMEIPHLRKQAYTGKIAYCDYLSEVLTKNGITDKKIINLGIEQALREKDQIHFFTDTLDTLKILKSRNLYLGIITDTAQPLYVKINKLERGGIGHFWDVIISSCETGVQKPDPEIYHLALQQLGISPCQAIFVGHKSSELDGARKVGMKTVAFNYEKDATADFLINNFSDLTTLMVLN